MASPFRILFFGTPAFAVAPLQALLPDGVQGVLPWEVVGIVTQPDRPAGRGQKQASPPVKELAQKHHLPVFQPKSLRKELAAFEAFVAPLGRIDLGVVVAFGQILPKSVLQLPVRGCINIHSSLLPRWRGAAPMQRAIMAGDAETGVCLMQMDEGLDTGAVLAESRCAISENDTFASVHDRLAAQGAQLLREHLPAIFAGSLRGHPQSVDGVTYAAKIDPKEAEVSFNRPSDQVSAHIRALSPAPGAFTFLAGQRVKLFMAKSVEHSAVPAGAGLLPGTIIRAEPDGIEVQCLRGAVVVTDLQLEGRKRLPVGEFLRGSIVKVGTRFGREEA